MSKIEHFAVYADDPTALKDFYVARVRPARDRREWRRSAGLLPRRRPRDGDRGPGPAGRLAGVNQRWVCHLAFWVDDVPAKRAELERLGFVFETETLVDNDEMKTAFFKDPGGNRCQIVWRRRPLGS